MKEVKGILFLAALIAVFILIYHFFGIGYVVAIGMSTILFKLTCIAHSCKCICKETCEKDTCCKTDKS